MIDSYDPVLYAQEGLQHFRGNTEGTKEQSLLGDGVSLYKDREKGMESNNNISLQATNSS